MSVTQMGDARNKEGLSKMLSGIGYKEGDKLVIILGSIGENGEMRIRVGSAEVSVPEAFGLLTLAEHEMMQQL